MNNPNTPNTPDAEVPAIESPGSAIAESVRSEVSDITDPKELEKQRRLSELEAKDETYSLSPNEQEEIKKLRGELLKIKNREQIEQANLEIKNLNQKLREAEGKLRQLTSAPKSKSERSNKIGSNEYFDKLQVRDGLTEEVKQHLKELRMLFRSKDILTSIRDIEELLESHYSLDTSNYVLAGAVNYIYHLTRQGPDNIVDSSAKKEIQDRAEALYLKLKEGISNLIARIPQEGTEKDKELVNSGYFILTRIAPPNVTIIENGICSELDQFIQKIRNW